MLLGIGLRLLGVGKWLKALPWQVWAGIGAVLLVLFAWHVHSGWERSAYNKAFNAGWAAQKVKTDAEILKHAITRSSLNTCTASIDAQNSAVAALKAAGDARTLAAESAVDDARRAAQGAETRARGLEVSAGAVRNDCAASSAFVAVKGEL